jgi:ketosteroid isomerase-like protein
MGQERTVLEVLTAVDAKDADAFAAHLTAEAVFRYGSQESVQGRTAIRDFVAGFFATVAALKHRVIETWRNDDSLVCRGEVVYTKPDGAQVTVPFVNVFALEGALIREYLVYIDPAPLFG